MKTFGRSSVYYPPIFLSFISGIFFFTSLIFTERWFFFLMTFQMIPVLFATHSCIAGNYIIFLYCRQLYYILALQAIILYYILVLQAIILYSCIAGNYIIFLHCRKLYYIIVLQAPRLWSPAFSASKAGSGWTTSPPLPSTSRTSM